MPHRQKGRHCRLGHRAQAPEYCAGGAALLCILVQQARNKVGHDLPGRRQIDRFQRRGSGGVRVLTAIPRGLGQQSRNCRLRGGPDLSKLFRRDDACGWIVVLEHLDPCRHRSCAGGKPIPQTQQAEEENEPKQVQRNLARGQDGGRRSVAGHADGQYREVQGAEISLSQWRVKLRGQVSAGIQRCTGRWRTDGCGRGRGISRGPSGVRRSCG